MNVTKKRTLGEKSKSAKGAVSMPTDLTKARQLFGTFSKIGAFTFGGGYAMIPLIRREIALREGWIEDKDILDILAVSESTPGPIAVNTATFIGQKRKGIAGGIIATLGVVFPSLVIITLIAGILTSFSHIPAVEQAFSGISVCVCVLIFNAVTKLWKKSVTDKATLVLCLLVFILSVFLDISPAVFVILCAGAGILFTKAGIRGK